MNYQKKKKKFFFQLKDLNLKYLNNLNLDLL
jgi:hypothetical protein